MGESAPKPPLTIPLYARGQQPAVKREKLPRKLPDGTTLRGYRADGRPIISRPVEKPKASRDRVAWGAELVEKERTAKARGEWYGTTIKPSRALTSAQWSSWAEEVLEEAARVEGGERFARGERVRNVISLIIAILCIATIGILVHYQGG